MGLIVCPTCEGRGTQTLHGAAFTAEDIYEAGGDEFIDDMKAGHYDHPCDYCGGEKVVDKDQYRYDMEDLAIRRAESGY